jgi:threonine/homoserine/homoserine lactone efflux protein
MNFLWLGIGGFIIGIVAAAPIGPVNLICIRRTLLYGPLKGFLSGLGAALGDGVFACIGAFSITAVIQWIEGFAIPIRLVGGIMMVAFGLHTFRSHVTLSANASRDDSGSLVRALVSTFALTITNPATFFGFAAMFAGLGGMVAEKASFAEASVTVLGVILGSAAWWFTLTAVTGILHRRINDKVLHHINQGSGLAVAAFGIAVLGHLAWQLWHVWF